MNAKVDSNQKSLQLNMYLFLAAIALLMFATAQVHAAAPTATTLTPALKLNKTSKVKNIAKKSKKAISKKKIAKKASAPVKTVIVAPPTEYPSHIATQEQMAEKANALRNAKAPVVTASGSVVAKPALIPPAASSSATATPAATASARAWSAGLSLGRSNSLYKTDTGEQASWDISATAGYKLNADYSASAVLDTSRDIKNPEDFELSRAQLGLSHKAYSFADNKLLLVPSVSLGLPVSRAQQNATFQASIGAGLKLAIAPEALLSPRLSLMTGLSLSRSIHKYDTAASGRINTQYSSSQYVSAGWNFTDELSLSGEIRHYNTFNYAGTMKEFYSHNQELGYTVNSSIALAAGHSFGSPYTAVWNDNGQDYNYKLVDETNSFVYANITFTVQ